MSGSSNYALPLTVKLVQNETVVSTHNPTTDVNGYFTLQDIPQGTYNIWVKHDKGLAVMPEVDLDAASVPFDFGTLLMGDANNDNVAGLTDSPSSPRPMASPSGSRGAGSYPKWDV